MRSIVNLSLPAPMLTVVDTAISSGNYTSRSEFFRELLRSWMEEKLLKDLKTSQAEMRSGKGKLLKSLKTLR